MADDKKKNHKNSSDGRTPKKPKLSKSKMTGPPAGYELPPSMQEQLEPTVTERVSEQTMSDLKHAIGKAILMGVRPDTIAKQYNVSIEQVRKLQNEIYKDAVGMLNPEHSLQLVANTINTYQYVREQALVNYRRLSTAHPEKFHRSPLELALFAEDNLHRLLKLSNFDFTTAVASIKGQKYKVSDMANLMLELTAELEHELLEGLDNDEQ